MQARKRTFSEHRLTCVSLVAYIRGVLATRSNSQATRVRFEAELEDHFSERYAREALNAAIE